MNQMRVLVTALLLLFVPLIGRGATLPAGYGVGRANDPADDPIWVAYDTLVAPVGRARQVRMAPPSALQRVNATFTVTTTVDGVPGSLRAAINSANASPGLDLITFAIGSGFVSLAPGSQLPNITDPVVIDGTTQPGFTGTPIVELTGTAAGTNAVGLVIKAGGTTVRGLIMNRFMTTGSGGFGIVLDVLGNNVIEGCWIGLDATGFFARPNAVNGIAIFNGSSGNRVGGTTPAQRNVVSGNSSSGIQIGTGNGGFNLVQGNWIGLNAFGTAAVANGGNGVFLNASDNTIGGTVPGARNVISGNALPGIFIGSAAQRTLVVGNYIGTDPTGTLDIGNLQNGVSLDKASNNQIGDGTFPGRNVISGNDFPGVYVLGPGSGNQIQGNFICTTAAGNVALGDGNGIVLDNATNTLVGGTTFAARNLVAGTPNTGIVAINGANQNRIVGNFVGTDSSGTAAVPALKGILLNGAPNNTIGGTAGGEGNVISGNTQYGVEIRGAAATGNKVLGNWIGSDPTGAHPVGNGLDGIVLNSSSVEVDAGNVIAFNGRAGVFDSTGTKYLIEGNSIFQNASFGIDNFPRGLTINDPLDADTGANDLQNFPVLDSSSVHGSNRVIYGRLDSRPSRAYRIAFYDNEMCGSAHFGEGRYFRGSTTVTTDATGDVYFAVPTPAGVTTPNYITATATDVLDGSTSEFSQCLCLQDADGDGIMDCWETQNWGIDINSDGVRDLDLYALGARPNHKDVFVELDAMNDHVPPAASIQMVIDALARAPNSEVLNPDGLDGINLHAALDETNITQQPLSVMFRDFAALKDQTFGTVAERLDPNHRFILAAKRLVYHYGMWVRTILSGCDSVFAGIAQGGYPDGGVDFAVSLGSTGPCGYAGKRYDVQLNAGAFMHELGHTLGLSHGGADEKNFKPNYYSVMNYAWAYPRPWQAPGAWRADYSHAKLQDLYESLLDEQVGLGAPVGAYPIITMPYTDSRRVVRQARLEPGVPVDWNGDGTITTLYVGADINIPLFGTLICCRGVADNDTTPNQDLWSYSDWANLRYNFRLSEGFRNPMSLSGFVVEPDALVNAALDALPPPRPTGHFVMDGVLDAAARPLATNAGITLYGALQGGQLYLATSAAAAQGADMVVLLANTPGPLRAAPLGKSGQVGAYKAALIGRATGDPAAWADAAEAPLTSVTVDSAGAVLEGVVDVGLLFGMNPPNLYLALAKYGSGAGGSLLAQAPAGNGDGNVDGSEFLSLAAVASVPPVPRATSSGLRIALAGAQPALHSARIRLTLATAARVDVALLNVAGRRVATVAQGLFEAGAHDLMVGEGLAPGVYFLVARALGETRTTRVVIIR